jgi:hypothetical protein
MHTERTLNYALKNDFHHVYETVLDLEKFGKFHPYMTKVEMVKHTPDHKEFFIKEKVLIFGFIPQRPSYYAKVYEVEKGKHIRYTSKVMGLIDLSINFIFNEDKEKNEVTVEEKISLKGNRIIRNILLDIMCESHGRLFKTLDESHI